MAEADAVRARMEAEANGIERRAAALSQNQEAVIAQQIAENLPEIVRAAASPFEHVGTFTVLNGAQGVTGALAEVIQQAGALASMARETLMPRLLGSNSQYNTDPTASDGAGARPAAASPGKASRVGNRPAPKPAATRSDGGAPTEPGERA
jgi:uncharacterized membrane protein YqiK